MEKWKRNLYIVWTGQVLSQISFGFGLPFMPYFLKEDLGVIDPTTLKYFTGLLSMAPALSMAFMAPVWGRLADLKGRKLMMLRAMFSASIIIFLMGLSTSAWMLLGLRTLQGFFTGTVGAANAFIGSNSPKEHMSYALGVLSSANFLGFSIGPFLGGICAESLGFRASFYIGALIMLIGALMTLFFIHEDPSTYGIKKSDTKNTTLKTMFQSVGIILVVLLLLRFLRSLFPPFMPLYLEELHGKEGIIRINGNVAMGISLATALSGFTLSRLGDKWSKSKVVLILLAIVIAINGYLIVNKGFWEFVIFYILLSFFIGGIEPLLTSLSTERVDPLHRGQLFGYLGLVGGLGWALAPAVGSVLSVQFGYHSLFYAMVVTLIMNFFMVLYDKRKGPKNERSL
ncbi:MFS transporter [Guggenheimella bovis]